MNFVNFARKASMIWFALGLILVGALLGGFGLYVTFRPDDTEYATAEAKISIILTDDTHGSDPTYTVYVNFEDLNGEMHNDVLIGGYSSIWKVGDIIKVKYDVNNPEENVGWDDGNLILYIVTGVGVVAFIAGIIVLIRTIMLKPRNVEEVVNVPPVNDDDDPFGL